MKPDHVRNEIARLHRQIHAQHREIDMLRAAGISTASAELLLARMVAQADDLRQKRGAHSDENR